MSTSQPVPSTTEGDNDTAPNSSVCSQERNREAHIVWIKSHGRCIFWELLLGIQYFAVRGLVRGPFIFLLRWHKPRIVWIIYGLTDRSSQSHSLRAHRSASHLCTILRVVSAYWGYILLSSPWNLLPVSAIILESFSLFIRLLFRIMEWSNPCLTIM